MPSYGMKQKPAGKDCGCKGEPMPGDREMKSQDTTIITNLKFDNIEYKGNAVLRANRG